MSAVIIRLPIKPHVRDFMVYDYSDPKSPRYLHTLEATEQQIHDTLGEHVIIQGNFVHVYL